MWFFKITLATLASICNVLAISVQISQPTAVTSKSQPQVINNYPTELSTHFQPPPQFYVPDPNRYRNARNDQQFKERTENEPNYYAVKEPKILLQIPQILPNNQQYDFYFPQAEDINVKYDPKDAVLQEMQPPSIDQEPNYYVEKPKKGTKKYSPNKKHVNYKNAPKDDKNEKFVIKPEIVPPREYTYEDYMNLGTHRNYVTRRPDRLTPKASMKLLRKEDFNTGEYLPIENPKKDEDHIGGDGNDKIAEKNERIEFQMHGFNGPNSYKFGYDTGKGENRQFRVEQRDKDGNVEGQYGFYDKRGKFNIIKYTSKLNEGFKAEKAQII